MATTQSSTKKTCFIPVFAGLVVVLGLGVCSGTSLLGYSFLARHPQVVAGAAWTVPSLPASPATSREVVSSPTVWTVNAAASPTLTPFQPLTNTPSPTATATFTQTATPTATETATPTLEPTSTPEPTREPEAAPESAYIYNLIGYAQSLPLSCESRSAVDWARFFGVSIDEMEFQYTLPFSDNPNTGFVGNPRGPTGRIPPNDYGVHAPPVAALLRAYGLQAESLSGMSLDELRQQIAAGRPAIVWVVGNVWYGGYGLLYTASDGETIVVAPYEHTVIVTGYDANNVRVVDGNMVYSASLDQFLNSWSVLGNMAIIAR